MNVWTEKEDGWNYSQDNLQRWRKKGDRVECESVPQGETLTQQQYADDCDVNRIMERYMKTGLMPQTVAPLLEGDFSNLPSYQEALHTIMDAEKMFMQIPAKTRLHFDNDPQKLMDYLKDEKNNEEAIKLGLKVKKDEPAPDPSISLLSKIAENTSPKPNP